MGQIICYFFFQIVIAWNAGHAELTNRIDLKEDIFPILIHDEVSRTRIQIQLLIQLC